ncbi:ABC transporter permease [Patescibacteria group bacterium]|jgi:putative ABC transport system permease protein|nr:ABC transporter permease [Patescibacteria group bacterium]
MKITDLCEEIWLGVSSNKTRSGLTMLGIVIGIASVIAMLAVGQGSKAQIEANIQSIGSNLLLVQPGFQRGAGISVSAGRGSAQSLTREDATALASISGVSAVSPETTSRQQIVAKGQNTNTSIVGTTPAYLETRNLNIAEGSFFTDAQIASRGKVAVIGPTTRDDLFGEGGDAVGQKIRIKNMEFTVIGVTAAKGGSGFTNQDDTVFIPISVMSTYFTGNDMVGSIAVKAANQERMSEVQASITALLLQRHGIADPQQADFSVLNQSDIASAASSATQTFTLLLASIAGISLLVGGIGIMNMMLTTVTERTREIGLRQAIGAEKEEIVGQFLGEAILLTVLGGLIGIGLGYGIAWGLQAFMGTKTQVAWSSVGLAFGVSAVIGLVFGYYPARRAAKLNPIQALKYE